MRILYLCHRIPYPPNKGDKIRAFHQLQALSERHEVDVFTLADEQADLNHQAAFEKHCHHLKVAQLHPKLARLRALPFLLTYRPLTLPYFYSPELDREVRHAMSRRSYDRIFVYCSAMAQYVERMHGIARITDLVDVDSDKWLQYAQRTPFPFSAVYRREGLALRRYERQVCERSACVLVSTEREAELVRAIGGGNRVQVVPNGVDTAYFNPRAVPPSSTEPAVIFTGDMSYFPNVDAVIYFAERVFPLVRKSVKTARFLIVGRNPSRKVQRLAGDGVVVTGFVPDVRTWLAQARVAVAPFTIAAGIQNKILEAMAYGLPVVTTSRTLQGLLPAVAALVQAGNTPEEMASQVIELLQDSRLASRRGAQGRDRVLEHYRWDTALARLLELVENPGCPSARISELA